MERFWAHSRVNGQPHVWTGTDQQTGAEVVMKLHEIEHDSAYDAANERARMEAHTLNELSGVDPRRIVNFMAFFRNSENQAVCSLDDVLKVHKKLSEHEAKVVIYALLEALVTCHQKYIVHRDVKPANLLLFTNNLNSVKLADFGVCAEDNGYSAVGGIKGTKGYMAPEVLKKQQYGRPVDLWGTGVVAYQLLYGQLPFPIANSNKPKFLSAKPVLTFPLSFNISNDAREFIKALLNDDPSLRPTAKQALQHPWLQSIVSDEDDAINNNSAQYAPDPPIIPEPVPGFPGWLRLVRGNEPAYYFHEPTRQTQWNHPEEDALPAYVPEYSEAVVVRNTVPTATSAAYNAANEAIGLSVEGRSKTERGRRRASATFAPAVVPARGFSNPEVFNNTSYVPVAAAAGGGVNSSSASASGPSSSSSPSSSLSGPSPSSSPSGPSSSSSGSRTPAQSAVTKPALIKKEDTDDEEDDEVPLIRKSKSHLAGSRTLSPPTVPPSTPVSTAVKTGKSVSFMAETTDILSPKSVDDSAKRALSPVRRSEQVVELHSVGKATVAVTAAQQPQQPQVSSPVSAAALGFTQSTSETVSAVNKTKEEENPSTPVVTKTVRVPSSPIIPPRAREVQIENPTDTTSIATSTPTTSVASSVKSWPPVSIATTSGSSSLSSSTRSESIPPPPKGPPPRSISLTKLAPATSPPLISRNASTSSSLMSFTRRSSTTAEQSSSLPPMPPTAGGAPTTTPTSSSSNLRPSTATATLTRSSSNSSSFSDRNSAPISNLTLTRVSLNKSLQDFTDHPHGASRMVVNGVVWVLIPVLAPVLRLIAVVFLLGQFAL
ncbi:hypothetical protein BDR26DRAFT_937715 [Obelidium mucronatum]|nr:hypothetical protein BDR26DRAFT_937715 [Obelidium mucronatum]